MTKTLTFAVVHFAVAFSVGYLLTGSAVIGSLLALVEPAVNTVAFHLHEKAWKRIEARRALPVPRPGGAAHEAQAVAMRASASAA